MNLNLTPSQFLVIYNMVVRNPGVEAKEIQIKMEGALLEILSETEDGMKQNKFEHWMKGEKEKVASLQDELKSINLPSSKNENK